MSPHGGAHDGALVGRVEEQGVDALGGQQQLEARKTAGIRADDDGRGSTKLGVLEVELRGASIAGGQGQGQRSNVVGGGGFAEFRARATWRHWQGGGHSGNVGAWVGHGGSSLREEGDALLLADPQGLVGR